MVMSPVHFSATTTVSGDGMAEPAVPVTSITGGLIGAVAGSGRMQISPVSIEAGKVKDLHPDLYRLYRSFRAI